MSGFGKRQHRLFNSSLMTLLTVALVTVSQTAAAEQIVVEYRFEPPRIETVIMDGQAYDRVIMADAPNDGEIGHPALPSRGAEILLPVGSEVTGIEIVEGEKILVGSGYRIEPVQKPFKLSEGPGPENALSPDPAVYESDNSTPAERFRDIGRQSFRGYRLQILSLHPVEYIPATNELYYYSTLTVRVNTTDSDLPPSNFRGLPADELQVAARADNVGAARGYSPLVLSPSAEYDFLIITTSSLASSFQPLKDYHDTTGILTEIRTTADVGSSDPDDVRDYIRQAYLNDGIEYVLIGGDDNLIPAKDLYVRSSWSADADIEPYMPGDIYFACLDGSFNGDGDGYWGEPTDGEDGGDVDLIAEVYIGRACVGNTTEVDRFVNKTIQYLESDDIYLFNALMLGEYLGFGGVSDYAAAMMQQHIDGSAADGVVTVGIPSETYEIDRLYDRDYEGNYWPTWELTTRINNGLHIINHLGHGSIGSAMKMTSSTVVSQLSNDNHYFEYSQTCLAGHFDGTDCFAEYMTTKNDHGAFAAVMNARYGWGTSYTTDGPSQRFNRQFWDAVFDPEEGKPEIGRANQDAKEDNLYRIYRDCMRWVYYESNLLGDPTVAIKVPIRKSLEFSHPGGIPAYVTPGQSLTLTTQITGINEGVPVPGSVKLNYSVDSSDYVALTMTETSPLNYEVSLPSVECGNLLEFYCSAVESDGWECVNPAPESPYSPEVATSASVLYETNFELDDGWTVEGNATEGHWERGVPAGDGLYGDPLSDYDGSGQCFLTANTAGPSGVVAGETALISPTFSLAEGDGKIRYARWFCNDMGDSPNSVALYTHVSNDNGATWERAEVVGPVDQSSGGWYIGSFWASDHVTPTDQMKVKFRAYDYVGALVEAAIDAVTVTRYACQDFVCGDLNNDQKVTLSDVSVLIDHLYISKQPLQYPEGANVNGSIDGKLTLGDISTLIDHIYISKVPLNCF